MASPSKLFSILTLIRVKQWVKNAFIFATLVFANHFLILSSVEKSIYAFLFFCIASSIVYVINDMHDIENDKRHPTKSKKRPLASGALTLKDAQVILLFLIPTALISAYILPQVALVILAYLILNLAYSKWLKHKPVLDIFSIATGFVLRVFAGAVAISVPISNWMFITTLCLALFLSSMKRRSELLQIGSDSRKVLDQYSPELISKYAEMSASGTLVFYSLYIVSEQPQLIMSIPMVLFGIYRYWYIASIADKGESPSDIVLEDRQLQCAIFLWLALVIGTFAGLFTL